MNPLVVTSSPKLSLHVLVESAESGRFVASVPELPNCLISCTWKYECQIHNYVQEELSCQDEVKKKTQQFAER